MTTDEQWDGGVLDGGGRLLDQIRLTGITATGYHGVFEFERREGQLFVADVVVHLDTRRAAARDDLTRTLHYGELAEQVAAVLSGEPVDLIETVAERIAATVLSHAVVQAVDVSVHKPQAPIEVPFGDVVVRIRRDRAKLPAAEPYLPHAKEGASAPVRPTPTPTASFPVTPPPGAPVVAAPVVAPSVAVPPVPVAAAVVPPTVPWSDIVPPLGSDVPPAPGALSSGGAEGPVAPVVPTFEPTGLTPASAPAAASSFAPTAATAAVAAVGATGDAPGLSDAAAGQVVVDTRADVVDGEIMSDALDVIPSTVVDVVLALGANLGSAQETLRAAVDALSHTPGLEVVQVSPLARTAAVGGPDQPDYLNAVVLGRTMLAPRELLRVTQAIEQQHGRVRDEHWGPRTLDIDIVVFGSVLAVTDDLELPHPRAHERAFVLEPWVQVDPQAMLPGLGGGPVAALAATAPDRDGIRWLALDWLTAAPATSATPDRDEGVSDERPGAPGS